VDKYIPHGADSMIDNSKPIRWTLGTLVLWSSVNPVGDTDFVNPLGVSFNELVCHPQGWYVLSAPWGVIMLWIRCRTHGWYVVSDPWGTEFNCLICQLHGGYKPSTPCGISIGVNFCQPHGRYRRDRESRFIPVFRYDL